MLTRKGYSLIRRKKKKKKLHWFPSATHLLDEAVYLLVDIVRLVVPEVEPGQLVLYPPDNLHRLLIQRLLGSRSPLEPYLMNQVPLTSAAGEARGGERGQLGSRVIRACSPSGSVTFKEGVGVGRVGEG